MVAPRSGWPRPRLARIASAIADDGSAVIAYSNHKDEVIAIDRAAAGGWSGPHGSRRRARPDPEKKRRAPRTAVAPGGLAAVAWGAPRGKTGTVSAASGKRAGVGCRRRAVSSPAFDGSRSGLTLTAGGVPRVFWIEADRRDGLRAATLAPAKLDTTPPRVIAHLPKRVRADAHRSARRDRPRALLGGVRRAPHRHRRQRR